MTHQPTPSQQPIVDAILAGASFVLVEGGPGTGKTSVALHAANSLLDKQLAAGEGTRCMFLTFSRAAVSQIQERAVRTGGLNHRDRIDISTFHGLCWRLLNDFGPLVDVSEDALRIQSPSMVRLLGEQEGRLDFDDLLNKALELLESIRDVRSLIQNRWSLIICDEVQDTTPTHWALLDLLAPTQVLALGDPDQMIYTFVPGVGPESYAAVRARARIVIPLPPASHRDPTGVIPALADAIRRRRWDASAIRAAVRSGRLKIVSKVPAGEITKAVETELVALEAEGHEEIAVFAHHVQFVGELYAALERSGHDVVLLGTSEAFSEGLACMTAALKVVVGTDTTATWRTQLAVFMTSLTRGRHAPDLALAMTGHGTLPPTVAQPVEEFERTLGEMSNWTAEDVVTAITDSWPRFRIATGTRHWEDAARFFESIVSRETSPGLPITPDQLRRIEFRTDASRVSNLIGMDSTPIAQVQIMNFNQTKGREADVVIQAFTEEDYFGRESEPFENASKLLLVSFSRARNKVVVILPTRPPQLVSPLANIVS